MAERDHSTPNQQGREAAEPQQIPPRGWKQVLRRSWHELSDNNIFLVAGGVTYAILLALFPGLAALVSIYGLVFNPSQIEQQMNLLDSILPQQTRDLIRQQLHALVTAPHGALGLTAIVSLLLGLWSASRGMSGLITAMNIAYEEKETRSFIRFNLLALGLTLGAIVAGVVVIALIGVLPTVVQFLGLGIFAKWLLLVLEWPLLLAILLVAMAVLYHYGANRDDPQWRWVAPGTITGAVLWILGSIAFSVYVSHFNSYNATYGSLGGAVVLLTWLYLSSFVLLLGAVINAQSERQTRVDTTEGQPRPMGQRNARAADTLGS
jgi:membrane protein